MVICYFAVRSLPSAFVDRGVGITKVLEIWAAGTCKYSLVFCSSLGVFHASAVCNDIPTCIKGYRIGAATSGQCAMGFRDAKTTPRPCSGIYIEDTLGQG